MWIKPAHEFFVDDSPHVVRRLRPRQPQSDGLRLRPVLVGVVSEVQADGVVAEQQRLKFGYNALPANQMALSLITCRSHLICCLIPAVLPSRPAPEPPLHDAPVP
jgi:hypothetical protein